MDYKKMYEDLKKENEELINKLNGIVNSLKNEVKSLKSNEKILEVWKGNKIITYDRIKNKVTWRYWWADLPWDLIEDLMKNEIKNYYKKNVLKIGVCGRSSLYNWKIYHSHTHYDLYEKYKGREKYGCCEGYLNNGKPCKNEGNCIKTMANCHYLGYIFDYDTQLEESKLIKYTNNYQVKSKGQKTYDDVLFEYKPNMCKRCLKKYHKRGNVFDEWLKDAGYGERNGYCIRIK